MPYFQSGSDIDQKIFYIDKGKGQEILFFIHGWYQNSRDCFGSLIDYFEHSYRTIAIDLPGHGSSYKHYKGEFSLLAAFRASEDLLLKVANKKNQVTLVGHSLGAFLAAKLAILHPEKVKAVVFISPVFYFEPYEKKLRLWLKLPLFLWPLLLRIFALLDLFPFGDRKYIYSEEKGHRIPPRLFYYRLKTANHPHRAAYQYAKSFLGQDIRPLLAKISCPTLVIYGGKDKTTPYSPDFFEEFFPNSQLEIIPQGGHNVQLSEKDKIIDKILEFLSEQKKPKSLWKKWFS